MDIPLEDIDAEGLSDLLDEAGELPVLLADPADVIDFANLHTYEDCESQLVTLIQSRDKNAFAMGDTLKAFEVNRGKPLDADATISKLAARLGCLPSQLSMWRAVAIFFPKQSREFETLRWSHYYLAMRHADGILDNALELLSYASDNEQSVSQFRNYIKGIPEDGTPEQDTPQDQPTGYAVVTGTGSTGSHASPSSVTDDRDGRVTLDTPAGLVDASTGEIIASAHVFEEGAADGNGSSSSEAPSGGSPIVNAMARAANSEDKPAGVAEYELYTPEWLIAKARQALGGEIDLDPASCAEAQTVVRANRYFDIEANGLIQPWASPAVFVNHPYGREHNMPWARKIVQEFEQGWAMKVIALVPAAAGSDWFQLFADYPRVFFSQRVAFWGPADKGDGPRFDSALIGLGVSAESLAEAFEDVGHLYVRYVRGTNGNH